MALGDVAAKLNVPVFPCSSNKRPITDTGLYAAATDPVTVLSMFSRAGAEMIGMPTGQRSGLVAIDVDPRHGGDAWLDENRDALPETRTHRTPRGGVHLIFVNPDDVEIRNSAGRVAPGVDVRGTGGYVILPPSPGYAIADHTAPAEMPLWLVNACRKAPEPELPPSPPRATSDRYAEAALDGEVAAVMRAGEGTRNDRLNVAAVKLGGLVASGALSRATVEAELTRAGLAAGLAAAETRATIASGLGFGMRSPRSAPDREESRHRQARQEPPPGEQPSSPEAEKPTAERSADIFDVRFFRDIRPPSDTRDFVEGLLIETAMSVVYGESNSGKTFFASDLACYIASGWNWNGREITRGGVIYCALEGAHGIEARIAAFRMAHGLEGYDLPLGIITTSMNLLDPDADTLKLVRTISGVNLPVPIRLIVLDTLSRAMFGGNENAPDDMGALVGNGDRIRRETGAHLMWVHHSGKDQAKGARGHSLLRAATDTEIEITSDGHGQHAPRQARVTKQRDLDCSGEFPFTLKLVELGKNSRGKPVTSCVVDYGEDGERRQPRRGPSLSGQAKRAYDVLADALASSGQAGFGAPAGVVSIPEKWWRDQFYNRAMVGAEADSKKKAFRRSADLLVNARLVGLSNGRVWLVPHGPPSGGTDGT